MENKEIINIPRPEHPEPMMQRSDWQNLNGEWLFEFDFGNTGKERGMYRCDMAEKYTKKIVVPFCPESKLSGIEYKDHMYNLANDGDAYSVAPGWLFIIKHKLSEPCCHKACKYGCNRASKLSILAASPENREPTV